MFRKIVSLVLSFSLILAVTSFSKADAAEVFTDPLLTERKLSDSEIAHLAETKKPAECQAEISTPADAMAYLDMRFPSLWDDHGISTGNNDPYTRYESYKRETSEECGWPDSGRCDMATIMTGLLCDDMDICSIFAVGQSMCTAGANCIKTGEGYVVFDPVAGMSPNKSQHFDTFFPEYATAPSIEEYVKNMLAYNKVLKESYDTVFVVDGGQAFKTCLKNGFKTVADIKPIYENEAAKSRIDPANIDKYELSKELGGVTLTPEEAYALIDAEPEEIQEKVKTAADVLMFMLAANIQDSHGDRMLNVDDRGWHYNMRANEVIGTRTGNCGSSSNMARYLLDGDYDEVGFIIQAYFPGCGGGHVYTYILQDEKYYIIDYSSYIFNCYSVESQFPALRFGGKNSLKSYVSDLNNYYGGLSIVVSENYKTDLPCIFDDEAEGGPKYVFPEGAEINVLKEDRSGYTLATEPMNRKYLDWNRFW